MCHFIETIKMNNGLPENLELHEDRVNKTRRECLKCKDSLSLNFTRSLLTPKLASKGTVYKCRILYAKKVITANVTPYTPKIIRSLKLVHCDEIEYIYKFENRNCLNHLFYQRGSLDDILVVRRGFITDTSIANVAFFTGEKWLTPTYPLLKGVKREKLISQQKIFEAEILDTDLHFFKKISLINAMLDLKEITLDIKNIKS